MSVTGNNVSLNKKQLKKFRNEVRMTMRDYAGMNIILDDVEFKDEDIELAIERARRRVNAITPTTNFAWTDIPKAILFLGTARYLMMGEGFLQLRNQMQTQTDGMGAVGIDDKFREYKQAENTLNKEFLQLANDFKKQVNMNQGFGNLSSGYQHVSRFNN